MTIQNGLLHDGVAYLWSDTAHWDPASGKRMLVANKVYQGTLWPWVVAISGDSHGSIEQLNRLPNLTSDALLRDARTALENEAKEGAFHRFLFAWPDEERGARMCCMMSEPGGPVEPYQAMPIRKYLCWGEQCKGFKPFANKDLAPADMREIVKLQMDNYDCPLFPNGIKDGRSDMIETRIGMGMLGIEHRQYRLIDNEWCEVPLGDGFGWIQPDQAELEGAEIAAR